MAEVKHLVLLPACERCKHFGFVFGSDYCVVYDEPILEPTYAAEDCPAFEADN